MNSDQKLKMYPSGFLGSAAVAQTKPMDVMHRARDMLQVRVGRVESRYTANDEVMEVLARALATSGQRRTFEDTEKILGVARRAFGAQYFGDWVTSQLQSTEFRADQLRYLEDTVQFVYTGKPRSMTARGWIAILSAQNGEKPRDFSDVIKHYVFNDPHTSLGNYFTHTRAVTVDDFIAQWVAREGGVDDLLSSLTILFGSY